MMPVMAWIDQLQKPQGYGLPFGLQLARAKEQASNPTLAALRAWLKSNDDRFVAVDLVGGEHVLRGPVPVVGLKPENPVGFWDDPATFAPGTARHEPTGNAGFVVWQSGVVIGHFVLPDVFDREVVLNGWTPHEFRQQLLRGGHLKAEPGRTTMHLPRALAAHTSVGQPQERLVTHSRGPAGLKYRQPRKVVRAAANGPRVLAVRGVLRGSNGSGPSEPFA